MPLSSTQIEQLYAFTRKHYVEHYDLQTELVDHLANGIEEQGQTNPDLTFEEALQKEFKKFGIFGFMDVVQQRQAALTKRYNRLVWQHFKAFFQLPKIVLTIVAIFVLQSVLVRIAFSDVLVFLLFLLLAVVFFIGLFLSKQKMTKRFKNSGKKWMLEELIFSYGSATGLMYLPVQFVLHFSKHLENQYVIWLVSTAIVLMGLLEYVLIVEIPKKSREYLLETYPEYKFENSL